MPETIDPTAWSAALLGLFAVAAAIGALRQPGTWRKLVEEVAGSPALQLTAGFIELFVGAAIYLVNPWDAGDVLSSVMKALGGLMMIEALVVAALSDLYFHFWLKSLAAMHRGWALATLGFGAVLAIGGFGRFV